MPGHISKPVPSTLETVGEPFVIKAQLVKYGSVKIIDMHGVLYNTLSSRRGS